MQIAKVRKLKGHLKEKFYSMHGIFFGIRIYEQDMHTKIFVNLF